MNANQAVHKKPPPLFREDEIGTRGNGRALWTGLACVVLIYVATRLVVWTSTYYGAVLLLSTRHQFVPPMMTFRRVLVEEGVPPGSRLAHSAEELLGEFEPLVRFDGVHYRRIVEEGYHYAPPPLPEEVTSRHQVEQNIAFFPLYPLIVRPLTTFLSVPAALLLVSHACTLAAAILLFLWVRWRIDQASGLFAVAAVLCWPSACYYSYAYAESVTLLLMVLALWLIDRRSWIPAAVASGLATATRPTALAIAVVFALAYWLRAERPARDRLARLVPLGLMAAGGIIGYAVFLTFNYGSPTVYLDNFRAGWVTDESRGTWLEYLTLARVWDQFKYFGRAIEEFPVGLVNLTISFAWNMPLNFFLLFLSLGGLGRVPRTFRPLLALGPLIFLQSYLASGAATFGVEPIARYMGVSVSAFVVLAAWSTREWKPGARMAFIALLLVLQAGWAFRFGLREWSG